MTQLATSGGHTVALTFAGTGQVSYNLVSSYNQPWAPQLPGTGPLALSVAYDRTSLAVDDSVSATVKISNQTAATQRMLLVTLGLPPGFELESADLSAYVANGQLSRFEQTGRQLILYVTALAARSDLSITYRLRATMPVRAADGGGQVQLYYQPDQTAKASSQMLVASGGL
jgi:uncharacterized protein YfaS (alpha-2-macroglobulin family)